MNDHLQDLEVLLPARPAALADLGQALGRAGVSVEGGGIFTHHEQGVAHYLVDDGAAARAAVIEAGVGTAVVREVIMTRLDQDVPGQLGRWPGNSAMRASMCWCSTATTPET